LVILGALLLLAALYTLFAEPETKQSGPTSETSQRPAETNGQPVRFDYYVLVLSWLPSYCASEAADSSRDPQCNSGKGKSFGLHGLWPAYAQGWPQDCQTGERDWVPQTVIDDMRDIMPSKSLIIHEYRAHGTCSGLAPARYFAVARYLYRRVAIPPRFAAGGNMPSLSPAEIEQAFVTANDWLSPGMIEVTCRQRQLLDVRVCFNRDLTPRACGKNEARRSCRSPSVAMSPDRGREPAIRNDR